MDVELTEDLLLIEVMAGGVKAQSAGVTADGHVFLAGDIHPLGSFSAMMRASQQDVPYVAVSAVEVLFPADWLAGECLADLDRLRIIANAEAFARQQVGLHGLR